MSDPSTSATAMEEHLQRYDTCDAGTDSDTHTTGGDVDAEETSFWGVVFAETSHAFPNNVRGCLYLCVHIIREALWVVLCFWRFSLVL